MSLLFLSLGPIDVVVSDEAQRPSVSMLEVLLHQYYIFDLRSSIACLRADGKGMADWLSDQCIVI